MNTEQKMGRPPIDKKTGPKGERIEIRVAASEKEAMEAAADRAGLKLSEWVRATLLRAAKRGGK